MTSPITTAALSYARMGWQVLPLQGKRPIPRDWPNLATTDEGQILTWFRDNPNANVGVAAGPRSGFFVLDVDGPEGERSLSLLLHKHGELPVTLQAITGGNGRHILFRYPEGITLGNSAKRLGRKLDIRGAGGQIVVAPSIHPDTGALYEWVSDPEATTIADAPEWLIELLTREDPVVPRPVTPVTNIGDERARRYGLGVVESQARELAACAEGGRNNLLNWSAFRLGQFSASCGITEAQAENALMDAAAACGLIKSDGRAQVLKTFRSGWAKGLADPRTPPESNREGTAPAPRPAVPVDAFTEELGETLKPKNSGPNEPPPASSEIVIYIRAGELDRVVDEAEAALIASGVPVFQRGGSLVRPIRDPDVTARGLSLASNALTLKEVEEVWLREALTKAATWRKWDGRQNDFKQVDAPTDVAKTLLARAGGWKLPRLVGIVEAPTLRPDGTVLEVHGYDEETGLYLDLGGTTFEPVPQEPTLADAHAALAQVRDVLSGFPFDEPHDEAIAVAAILTGLVRRSIPTSPMFAFNAPKMASGKSLLADVVSLFATGREAAVMTMAPTPEEEGKRLLAILMEGDPVVCIDNISGAFESDAMCTVLTQKNYKGRVLGSTRNANAPTSVTWLATGNNIQFMGDLTTRVLRCDLDPKTERPEERQFDRDLRQYIPRNRAQLAPAALTILRAYHVAGRPVQGIPQFGRFEAWSDWVRSALVWAGMPDPCLSRRDLEQSDTVRTSLVALLDAWHSTFGRRAVTVQEAIASAKDHDGQHLLAAMLDVASAGPEVNARKLGKYMKRYEKRIEGGYRLEQAGTRTNCVLWQVTQVGEFGEKNECSSKPHERKAKDTLYREGETHSPNPPNSPGLFSGDLEGGEA